MAAHADVPGAVSGLDIGSNTFSLAVVGQGPSGPVVLGDTSVAARLSEGLVEGGALLPGAVSRGLAILERLVARHDLLAMPVRAVGTAVLRMATNPAVFTAPASRIIGVPVEIIDGREEALLTARGALLGLTGEGPWILIDIGGQSTEIGWLDRAAGFESRSLPLGVVALTERFLPDDPPAASAVAALADHVAVVLSQGLPPIPPGTPLAVAGTATTLARLAQGGGAFDRARIHGAVLDRASLGLWLRRMLELTAAERTARHGIKAGRADVFLAGLVILDRVLDHLCGDQFWVSASGLRVGAALSILPKERG